MENSTLKREKGVDRNEKRESTINYQRFSFEVVTVLIVFPKHWKHSIEHLLSNCAYWYIARILFPSILNASIRLVSLKQKKKWWGSHITWLSNNTLIGKDIKMSKIIETVLYPGSYFWSKSKGRCLWTIKLFSNHTLCQLEL